MIIETFTVAKDVFKTKNFSMKTFVTPTDLKLTI